MPRSAHRFILSLLVILAAISLVYGVLSWKPENPLGFQAIAYSPDSNHPEDGGVMELLVTNRSNYPIRVYHAFLHRETDSDENGERIELVSRNRGGFIVIPGRKVVRAEIHYWDPRDQMDGGIGATGTTASYLWMSSTRGYFRDFYNWIGSIRSGYPVIQPGWHESTAPLSPPSGSVAAKED